LLVLIRIFMFLTFPLLNDLSYFLSVLCTLVHFVISRTFRLSSHLFFSIKFVHRGQTQSMSCTGYMQMSGDLLRRSMTRRFTDLHF
jgi:hypothetical protein